MKLPSGAQGAELLHLLLCGVLIGFTYELFFIPRRLFFRSSLAAVIVCDLLFSAAGAAIFFIFAGYASSFELRAYTFIMPSIGLCAEFFTLHFPLAKGLDVVYNRFKRKRDVPQD